MKNIAIIVFVTAIIVVLGLLLFSFQVRQTELALVTTFGKPTRQITEPGWYFKWPVPIQNVHKFDSRLRVLEAELTETTTKGAFPIILNTYIVWKIAEPLRFFNSLGNIADAEDKLLTQLNNTRNNVIGQYNFSEFVNNDASKIKIKQIQLDMLQNLQQVTSKNYGIEIKDLGIKQLQVSADVSKAVFARMIADRTKRTENTISEGENEAKKIREEADAQKREVLAAAQERAKAIIGQGDAEAAKYYKELEQEPQLAIFLRNIDALKKILEKNSTYIISAEEEPFNLLKQMPKFGPLNK